MITGKIVDKDSNPVYSASVYFWNSDNSQSVTESTNQSGNYYATPPYSINEILYLIEFLNGNFSQDTQGNYQGYVTAPGYLPRYIPSKDLKVRNDQTTIKNVTLIKKSHVKGVIKNKNNAKLANITVTARKFGQNQPFASTVTDSTGHYNIEIGKTGSAYDLGDYTVANKTYIIEVGEDQDSRYGYGSKQVSFSKDAVTKTGVNFKLSPKNKSFRGQVKNSSGKILKGAKVQLTLLNNANLTFTDYTNQQGQYRINNLVSGHYQVSVSRGNYSSIGISDLKINKNIHKDFKMKSAGVISGFIFSKETNSPISGITVRLVGSGLTGITDVNGHYEIPCVPVGSYKVFVNDPAYVEKMSGKFNVKKNKSTDNVNLTLSLYANTLK